MEFSKILFTVLAFSLHFCNGIKVAVFEHAEQSHSMPFSPNAIKQANLQYYKNAAKVAKQMDAHLIVFPEYGTFPPISDRKLLRNFLEFIPDPKTMHTNPCKEAEKYSDRPILHTLSCIAKNNNIILVANMGDIQPCKGEKGCPDDDHFNYNTNVAFDRNGMLLAKYHKEHLFFESAMDLPTEKQDPTFQCDLGRFAMFVCFDVVYQRIVEVAHWKGVDAVLLPTMWVNAGPLFNSIQYFESWAIGNNVTLLAANVQLPGIGGMGSIIVDGQNGAQVYTFNPDGHSKLLIADINSQHEPTKFSSMMIVTENESWKWEDDGKDIQDSCSNRILPPPKDIYKDYRCLEKGENNFTLIKLTDSSGYVEAFSNGMHCSLDYIAKDMKENFYLGVYNGTYSASNRYFFPEENCFLARCDDFGKNRCVTFPMRSSTIFYKINLKANFSTNSIYPSVTSSGMRLVPAKQWEFVSSGQTASISFKSSGIDILVVGFKARCYDRDPPFKH